MSTQRQLPKPSWRWPLAWLYVLTMAVDGALALRLGWIYFHYQEFYRTGHWFLLALALWLVLVGVSLLALVLLLKNLFRRCIKRALAWAVLGGLAFSSCAIASFPVVLLTFPAVSVGEPPPGSSE